MKRLLDAVGESHWTAWIEKDIDAWRDRRDTSHHLSGYGGMGSFNDVIICRANSHRIDRLSEPWANRLFDWLKALCYFFAHRPNESRTAQELSLQVGRDDPALAAFLGGRQAASESSRGLSSHPPVLHGWQCRQCSASEVKDQNIDDMILQKLVPNMVFAACESGELDGLVEQILASDIPRLDDYRSRIASAARASGIRIVTREDWLWKCPYCQSDQTGASRWFVDDVVWTHEPIEGARCRPEASVKPRWKFW